MRSCDKVFGTQLHSIFHAIDRSIFLYCGLVASHCLSEDEMKNKNWCFDSSARILRKDTMHILLL